MKTMKFHLDPHATNNKKRMNLHVVFAGLYLLYFFKVDPVAEHSNLANYHFNYIINKSDLLNAVHFRVANSSMINEVCRT